MSHIEEEYNHKMSSVKLIAHTVGVGELAGKNLSEIMAYVARVSNPSNQMNDETADKLLAYCLKNEHWSVFETVSVTVEITTSRAIAQQILRHRSFVFQEFSQRYATALSYEAYPARRQDEKNRQSSHDDMSEEVKIQFLDAQELNWKHAKGLYDQAIRNGVAKEQARFMLPLGTQTVLYMTGSIRSWITYCKLRGKRGTQKEHQDIALGCLDIISSLCPNLSILSILV
jgi:thymidylate synthase (FAD)